FITCIGLSFYLTIAGQQSVPAVVSGNFMNTPFADFVKIIEKNTALKFFYLQDWVKNVTITFSGTNIQLTDVLNDQLKKTDLAFFIDVNNVYIFQGARISTELPDYIVSQVTAEEKDTLNGITETERKYLEGNKIALIEVLEIGDKQKATKGTKCIISGKIIDESNEEPLIGATVYIEDLKTGATTDIDGRFIIVLTPGKYKAAFNYMSMKQQEYYLQVYSSGQITIQMRKELIEIDEVKIIAYRNDNIRGIQMGYEKISAKTLKEIPAVFGEKDVLKVAQMLPGVLNVGEGSSGFNVRGSSSDQNMFYFNKVPVYNTSHLFGFFTSFNPDVINDFTLYKSNIPASYGGRLASVFNITTRQGSKKRFFGQGGISPITAHFSLEVPAIRDKVSIVVSGRGSYSDWILKKIKDPDIRKSSAFFYDGTFSVNAEINDKNLIKAFGYISKDKFSLSSINDYNYSNTGSSLVWKHLFSSSVTTDVAVIYSNYSFENINKTNLSTAYSQKYVLDHYEFRTDFSLINKADHKIEFGASGILYNLDRGYISPFGEVSTRTPVDLGKETALECAVYLSDEFSLTKNLTVLSGLRYSLFNQYGPAVINKYYPEKLRTTGNIKETQSYKKGELIKSYSGPEYRVALNYVLDNNNSLKASYNRMYQYVFMLSNTIAISPDDKWKICDYHISPPVADQISVGYYRNFVNGGIKATLELYHKWINNQVEYKDGTDFTSSDPIETQVLQGKQRVNGVEMMISKNVGKTTGWLSYCYSRSFIQVDGGDKALQINYGIEYPSNYDRPHSLNLVLNYMVNRRLSLSTDFVYTTGRPITYPVSVYYSEGQEMLQFSKRNEYRITDYIRLDLSIKLEGNLYKKKVIHSYWTINLYNALGRKNAYSVYYSAQNGKVQGQKMSIFGVPLFTVSWNYKFGNYLND
ncbi:MAG: TonB-dependent receptor, partial [Bacteroidales bacterium]